MAAVFALTLGCCAVIGAAGVWALYLIRRTSLRYQLVVATLIPVLAVGAAVALNVRLMLLSSHDSTVVLLALATSVLIAGGVGWLIARRITAGSERVGAGLDLLIRDAAGGAPPEQATPVVRAALPAELARVLDDLGQTRATLADSRRRERAAEESRRELVSFMSHDLRTPLAGLRALTEGLEDGLIKDVPRALAQLRTTVGRMTVLVDDLFALSRLQGSPDPRGRRPVSISEVVMDVADSIVTTEQITVVLPDDDPLAVLGDADDLTRAIENLISNAVHYTGTGFPVTVAAARLGDRIELGVSDGCGGISESDLPRVFDPGWRASAARTDDGGAGLGLAIARSVVLAHGGTIEAANRPPGCRFAITLPAADQPVRAG